MKFSFSWLKSHLNTTATAEEICENLIKLGIEVEGLQNPLSKLTGFVVAHVVKAERHPNADRLSLCVVEDGTQNTDGTPAQYQVVCGAPNVRADMKVAFAKAGTVIPNTGLALKKGMIRGIESQGMLCSTAELMLGTDSDGIMDLPYEMITGTDLSKALQNDKNYNKLIDPLFDISLTPNRSDCFSVFGLARDLAATNIGTLITPTLPTITINDESDINITIDNDAIPFVPHFAIRVIKNIKNCQSPTWIQERLIAAGCRPISALVDITNYMCLDLGRPMHVFDYNKIKNKNLTLTLSQGGEIFEALNDKDYILEKGMIIIIDAQTREVLSLAGIMGGRSTSVDDLTTDIVLESALFDKATTAFSGQRTAILSDARTRFERGVNPLDVVPALDIATAYIQKWCNGTANTIKEVGENTVNPPQTQTVVLSLHKLHSITGEKIPLSDAIELLKNLHFTILNKTGDESITVGVPPFRHDISIEVDLIEEVLRLKGYDNIPEEKLPLTTQKSNSNLRQRLSVYCTMQGYNETYTWSFISKETAQLFQEDESLHILLEKPLNADMAVMRPSVLAGLLKISHQAQNRSQPNVQYFEFASHFKKQSHENVIECPTLSGLRVFSKTKRHWQSQPMPADFFTVKREVINILNLCSIQNIQIEAGGPVYYHNGRVATIKQGKNILAFVGEIHPHVLKEMNIEGTALAFEIMLNALPSDNKNASKAPKAFTPAIYQPMHRDLAFWVDRSVSASQLISIIQKVDKNLITSINLFDIYEGEKAPADKKSIAVELTLQPMQHTLNLDEVADLQKRIADAILQGCGGIMRDN